MPTALKLKRKIMWMVYALLAAVLWGLNYSLSERILNVISPASLLALEMISGAFCFSILAYCTSWKKDWQKLTTDSALMWITLAEIIVLIVASLCIVVSIRAKNATAAGIIELIYPLFTIGFTWFVFKENHVNPSVIVGGILIFIGVLVIARA